MWTWRDRPVVVTGAGGFIATIWLTRVRPTRSEVQRLRSDNSLAATLLGWTPQVSLEDGLRRTIEWISGHLERLQVGEYVI
jgi:hypothetical protein